MNLKQLHSFLVIAEEHQITSAAKRLYTAQPPLSYQMKQLEEELDTKLFQRTAHGIKLTPAGTTFQKYARQLVSIANNAKQQIHQTNNGTSGTLKIGLISSAGQIIMTGPLSKLTDNYPLVNVEITEGNTYELIQALHAGTINLAIVRSPFNAVGLQQTSLMEEQMVAISSTTNPTINAHQHLTINDLAHQPLILYRRFEALFNDTFRRHGIDPFYAVKCDDARTAILAADSGMGIALVPHSIATLYANHPFQIINEPSWSSTLQLVWMKETTLDPLTKRVIKLFNHSQMN
ncbi:MAG TPA: LysR family transcriptional regulator [Candidatus Limosilactobacillus excrementigallinarum]|nr:LysR family transcriptional regulator [Candidatus Limosilactobacillus excrementigallinarum]